MRHSKRRLRHGVSWKGTKALAGGSHGTPNPANPGAIYPPGSTIVIAPGGVYASNNYLNPYLQGNGSTGYLYQQLIGRTVFAPPELDIGSLPTEIKAGELIAWRCWAIAEDGTYRSTTQGHVVWKEGTPVTGNPKKQTEGVHAWKTRQGAEKYARQIGVQNIAVGTVSLWGTVIEHEEGYRAEFGELKEVVAVETSAWGPHYYRAPVRKPQGPIVVSSTSWTGRGPSESTDLKPWEYGIIAACVFAIVALLTDLKPPVNQQKGSMYERLDSVRRP